MVSGYRFDGPVSAREVLEPLTLAYGVDATERDGSILFRMRGSNVVEINAARLVEDGAPAVSVTRAGMEGADLRVRLRHIDAEQEHEPGIAMSEGSVGANAGDVTAPLVMDRDQAKRLANGLAEQLALERDGARFAMAADGVAAATWCGSATGTGASWRSPTVR